MKVTIKENEQDADITFKIRSKEDAIRFHDDIAIKITQGPHTFLSHAYVICKGEKYGDCDYDI